MGTFFFYLFKIKSIRCILIGCFRAFNIGAELPTDLKDAKKAFRNNQILAKKKVDNLPASA